MDIERFGFRSAEYSSWHRTASLRRYLGPSLAAQCAQVDLDFVVWLEMSDDTKEPLLLVETALDNEQTSKATSAIRHLARRAGIPAYCVLYRPATNRNDGDRRFYDIERFRVRRVWPDPDADWTVLTPQAWAERLLVIRARGAARIDKEQRATPPPLELVSPGYQPGTQ